MVSQLVFPGIPEHIPQESPHCEDGLHKCSSLPAARALQWNGICHSWSQTIGCYKQQPWPGSCCAFSGSSPDLAGGPALGIACLASDRTHMTCAFAVFSSAFRTASAGSGCALPSVRMPCRSAQKFLAWQDCAYFAHHSCIGAYDVPHL